MKSNKTEPYELNKRFTFGTTKTVTSPVNGSSVKKFVELFTLWGCYVTRTMTQQYTLLGTSIQDTVLIKVRHNKGIIKALQVSTTVEKSTVTYEVVDVSPDESNNFVTYDLVTLKKTSK